MRNPCTLDTPIDTSGYHSVGPWPAGFRGIGGHLIRPPAAPAPAEAPVVPVDWFDVHAEYLLARITALDGARVAACPVCLTPAALPPEGGWIEVCCGACGTDFVASDGSPPPPARMLDADPIPMGRPLPVAAPVRPSPLLPPVGDWEPLPDEPRGFTSDVFIDRTGRRFVVCPQCHRAEVDIPAGAWLSELLRCPACHGAFLVNLTHDPRPIEPPGPPAPPPVFDSTRKLWSRCPNCGLAALTPERTDSDCALVCTACRQRIIVSKGRRPPRPLALPSHPSMWERISRWLRGG